MDLTPAPGLRLPVQPREIPGLVAFWNFDQSGEQFRAQQGEPYVLHSQSGVLSVVPDADAYGGAALEIQEGQWLSIARRDCPKLDVHGRDGHLSLIAWLRRSRTSFPHCEFIAGQWNETNLGRQYGLFLNISVWGAHDRIFGHLSNLGGPTPGYKYCMDGPMGASPVPWDRWTVAGMTYDGQVGSVWMDGRLDALPVLNPYSLAGGLHDGGPSGSDFTVGAVHRSGEMGNFFCGRLAALAVYQRALSPAEMFALNA